MKVLIIVIIALLMINNCHARSIGCFLGVIGASNSQSFEISYYNWAIKREKKSTELLPFLGCGISFDF